MGTSVLDPAPPRRAIRLDLPVDETPRPAPRVRAWRRPMRPRRSLALLAERLVGDWAPTLRQSLVLVAALGAVLLGVVLVFGVTGVLLGLALCTLARLVPGLRRRQS